MQGPCPVTKTSVFAPNTGQGQVEGEPPAAAPQGTPSHPELSPWFFFFHSVPSARDRQASSAALQESVAETLSNCRLLTSLAF